MRLSPESDTSNCGQAGTLCSWPVPYVLWREQHQKNTDKPGPARCCLNEETSEGPKRRGMWSFVAASLAWGLVTASVHCQQELERKLWCLCSGDDHQNMVHTVVAEGGAMPNPNPNPQAAMRLPICYPRVSSPFESFMRFHWLGAFSALWS